VSNIDASGLVKVNLFGLDDDPVFHQRIGEYKDDPNKCLVYAHALPGSIADHRSGKWIYLTTNDLTKLLLEAGCKKEMSVELYACAAGQGKNSAAESLSKFDDLGQLVRPMRFSCNVRIY
jgi:hypothetical protein